MAVLPTQFPGFWANNSHNSSKVASGWAATISLKEAVELFKWLYLGFPWVSAVNSPLFFVAWPVFELSFYWRKISLLFFWSTASELDGLLLFLFANLLNMLSLVYFFNLFLLYLITPGSAVSIFRCFWMRPQEWERSQSLLIKKYLSPQRFLAK